MIHFKAKMAQDLYYQELTLLIADGQKIGVRGKKTIELYNAISEVEQPEHHCILMPSRRWNPWLALSEFLWIMAGLDDITLIKPYNSNIKTFSDDGHHLYGAYGARIYHQLDDIVARLRHDPQDRRAVLSIWEKRDLTAQTKDPPCNDMVFFKIRDDKLFMTVLNRSNDIHWGLFAVNLTTFGLLQEYLASRLSVGLGVQTHLSNSLHVYVQDPVPDAITENVLNDPTTLEYPLHRLAFQPGECSRFKMHNDIADQCLDALYGTKSDKGLFLNFATEFLTMYRERVWNPEVLDHRFADWIKAGEIFAASSTRFHS